MNHEMNILAIWRREARSSTTVSNTSVPEQWHAGRQREWGELGGRLPAQRDYGADLNLKTEQKNNPVTHWDNYAALYYKPGKLN